MSLPLLPYTTAAGSRSELLSKAAGALDGLASLLRLLAEELPGEGEDPILTPDEAARELKRSASYIREKCRKGQIKAMEDGSGWRIRRSALAEYERKKTHR